MCYTILNDIFASRATTYNLRNLVSFEMRKVYTAYNGKKTLSCLGPKIWSLVSQEIRQSVSHSDCKLKIKKSNHLIVPADFAINIYIMYD